jgi:uncharacterized membrane protein
MYDVVIARALHVLAVVIWIGGVAMVTMVVLPAIRHGDVGPNRLPVFEAIARRFVWPARIATVCVWLLFTVVLFVAEPLILHRWFHARASATPGTTFAFLHWAHWLTLVLSLITILGAVAGSQGTSLF